MRGIIISILVAVVFIGGLYWLFDSADRRNIQQLKESPRVIWIGKCEYITFHTDDVYLGITHKGDCMNPIHPENR